MNNLIRQEFTIDVNKPGLSPSERAKISPKLKTRTEHLQHLKDPAAQFDILVIGGGCNGTGVVLDAASRGLKCAVIDSYDFAAGTSSKSTKLAHGGIRYFQQMCYLQGDPIESYNLLKETLGERNYFLQAAPYLVKEVKLLVPTSSFFWSLFWYFPGQIGYHLIYLRELMMSNYLVSIAGPKWLSKGALIREFPGL